MNCKVLRISFPGKKASPALNQEDNEFIPYPPEAKCPPEYELHKKSLLLQILLFLPGWESDDDGHFCGGLSLSGTQLEARGTRGSSPQVTMNCPCVKVSNEHILCSFVSNFQLFMKFLFYWN